MLEKATPVATKTTKANTITKAATTKAATCIAPRYSRIAAITTTITREGKETQRGAKRKEGEGKGTKTTKNTSSNNNNDNYRTVKTAERRYTATKTLAIKA